MLFVMTTDTHVIVHIQDIDLTNYIVKYRLNTHIGTFCTVIEPQCGRLYNKKTLHTCNLWGTYP